MKTKIRYVFKCKCGHEQLEQIFTNVTVTSPVLSIGKSEIEYAYPIIDDDDNGAECMFQCAKCGEVIAHDEDEIRMKFEQEYYVELPTFIEGILRLFPKQDDDKEIKKNLIQYLRNKGVEIEEE